MSDCGLPAVILAGGQSRRMGTDKARLRIAGRTLLDHAIARLSPHVGPMVISRHTADINPPDGIGLVTDEGTDFDGPLAGIAAALCRFRGEPATHMLSIAVDSPFFPRDISHRLSAGFIDGGNIAIAACEGHRHPAFGIWPIDLAESLADHLREGGSRRMTDVIERYPHITVEFPMVSTPLGAVDPFFNINTPADLDRARELAPHLS
ncbi:molybdenum cofactor guanylyltransferase MobA [Martelella endophytica]|uniref:Molybdenum cofactor guanylyltransferase n=1 Tax=Martelella endophytica TaxID=1486262 RepID=A0A0D5LU12_MAREN|nr:molybdenum cofactor guanylyltransferase MobA [Martelella endophytica]AJY47450.1 hypothetical protein TM49_20110 [Martelella endophytica]